MPTTVLKAHNFQVETFKFTRNGRSHQFHMIRIPPTVTILPILEDGRIVMERQYRPVIKEEIYELPAGHTENGERPAKAAVRELEEELGYTPAELKLMFKGYISPGSSTELMYFYIARKLRKMKAHPEQDEFIEEKIVTLPRAIGMVRNNKITDTKTISCLLFYKNFGKY